MNIQEITQQALRVSREQLEQQLGQIAAVQERVEGLITEGLEQVVGIPEQGKETVKELLRFGREVGENARQQLIKGHEAIEGLVPEIQ